MIRPYKSEDKEFLLDIFKLNTPKYLSPDEIDDLVSYLDENWKTYLTVESENQIIGGAGYQITDDGAIGRITWIFFHPDCVGLGMGRNVVEYCFSLLRKVTSIRKVVVATSQLAYRFFEKFGFQLTRTEKDYWGEELDLYFMEMNLNK